MRGPIVIHRLLCVNESDPHLSVIRVNTKEHTVAIVTRYASDLTGTEGPEEDFVQVTIREGHPQLDEPKALDVLPAEIEALVAATDIVEVEVKPFGSLEPTRLLVRLADFRKVVPDEALSKARGIRGRRPGFRPGA